MRLNVSKVLGVILTAAVVLCAVDIVANRRAGVSDIDRRALEEFQAFTSAEPPWRGVDLATRPFVFMSKESHSSYLITDTPVSSVFASPVDAPAAKGTHVYRLARTYPRLWGTWLIGGNFNTIGKPKRVLGNDAYYVKFSAHSFDVPRSSQHFITFLAHEAFHFYGQDNWSMDPGPVGQPDLALLNEELMLFDAIRAETDSDRLRRLARSVVEVERRRLATDPEYVSAERWKTTVEGTASYVGIKASEAIGYDFGPMYFDNVANAPFSEVVPLYREGKLDAGFLAGRLPYETGAQLALLLDALDPTRQWQLYLNDQESGRKRTLIDALEHTLQ